jgi:outer membrane protein insertion porin family
MISLAPALLALCLAAPAGPSDAGGPPPLAQPAPDPLPSPAARDGGDPGASAPPPPGTGPAAAASPPAAVPLPSDPSPQTRRYQIERIRIVGLGRTRDAEVRRHLLVAEGELLDEERVLLSRLRLLQLGWFSRVETRVERGSERGLVVLVVAVTERNTLIVTDLIIGSTKPEPIYGGLGLSQQNFLGRGFGLAGAFVYGGSPFGRPQDPDRFALRGSFFVPNLEVPGIRHGVVAGATGLLVHGEEFTCPDPECRDFTGNYGQAPRVRYRRLMGEGTVGIRPGPFERLLASYRYEAVRASDVGPPSPNDPAIVIGQSQLSAVTGTYELDTRDDFFFPREGLRGLFQVTFGSRLLGGDYEYSRYLLQLETAFSLGGTLRFQGAVGVAQGGAPFFDRFYAADFSYFALGPALGRALELNFSTDSRYDAFVAMGGLEYGIPLWSGGGLLQRGYVTIGARAVHSTATLGGGATRVSRSPFSGDLALRFDTPVGVFNFSAGYLLDIVL